MESISTQISKALREALDADFVEAVETGYYGNRFQTLQQDLINCLTGGDVLTLNPKDNSRILLFADGAWEDLDDVELASEEVEALKGCLATHKEGV